ALRKARELTQAKLADLSGMKQSAVSRIEQAEYASWTLATLFKVAAALDARWRMTLEPAEQAVKEFAGIDEAELAQPSTVRTAAAAEQSNARPTPKTGLEWVRALSGGDTNSANAAPSLGLRQYQAAAEGRPDFDIILALKSNQLVGHAGGEQRSPVGI